MALKTGREYQQSIARLALEAHVMGRAETHLSDHGLVRPSLAAVAVTYDGAHSEGAETRALFRVHSPLCGGEVNRFTHLHRSTEDLMKKVTMQRYCGHTTGCCFQRCVGMDTANVVYSTTFDCDADCGTDYHQRFNAYCTGIQEDDLAVIRPNVPTHPCSGWRVIPGASG